MSEIGERTDVLFSQVKEYVQTNVEIARLKAVLKVSEVAGTAVHSVCWTVSALIFLLFVSISAGLYLGDVLGNTALGFLCVAGFYFLLMLIFLVAKNATRRSVMNSVIKSMLKEETKWNQ